MTTDTKCPKCSNPMSYLETVGAYVCNCQPIKKMKGAFIRAYWNDQTDKTETFDAYVSFGTYDETTGKDSFGVNDDEIFFYFSGRDELERAMSQDSKEDFTILSYEIVSN